MDSQELSTSFDRSSEQRSCDAAPDLPSTSALCRPPTSSRRRVQAATEASFVPQPPSSPSPSPATALPPAPASFPPQSPVPPKPRCHGVVGVALRDFALEYQVGNEINTGSFGRVFVCRHRRSGTEYACKRIAKAHLRSASDVNDVRREVAVLHALSLPVLGEGREEGAARCGAAGSAGGSHGEGLGGSATRQQQQQQVETERDWQKQGQRDQKRQRHSTPRQHPGVVKLHDVVEDASAVYLVMELCRGGDLFDVLRDYGSLPERSAKLVLCQLAAGLSHCHSRGVLHRDIKPENIIFSTSVQPLFTEESPCTDPGQGSEQECRDDSNDRSSSSCGKGSGSSSSRSRAGERPGDIGSTAPSSSGSVPESSSSSSSITASLCSSSLAQGSSRLPSPPLPVAKLTDFGLSIFLRPGETAVGYTGSRFYTAPEMVRGGRYGFAADIWSLGVVLCGMLTGRLPFAGRTRSDNEGLKRAILRGTVDFETRAWTNVSEEAKDLVRRMLVLDPSCRLTAEGILAHPWLSQGSAEVIPRWESAVERTANLMVVDTEAQAAAAARISENPSCLEGEGLGMVVEPTAVALGYEAASPVVQGSFWQPSVRGQEGGGGAQPKGELQSSFQHVGLPAMTPALPISKPSRFPGGDSRPERPGGGGSEDLSVSCLPEFSVRDVTLGSSWCFSGCFSGWGNGPKKVYPQPTAQPAEVKVAGLEVRSANEVVEVMV